MKKAAAQLGFAKSKENIVGKKIRWAANMKLPA